LFAGDSSVARIASQVVKGAIGTAEQGWAALALAGNPKLA
jgi:hypothetical protein